MINLISIPRLIAIVSVLYAGSILIGVSLVSNGTLREEGFWPIRVALAGSSIVYVIVLFALSVGWRVAWWLLPELNHWLFPDINGEWKGEIHYVHENKAGVASVDVRIIQTFAALTLKVESARSASETIVVVPRRNEHGLSRIHYSYLNIPKHVSGNDPASYEGSATLDIDHSLPNQMSGNYFTAVGTRGRFSFWRERQAGPGLGIRRVVLLLVLITIAMTAYGLTNFLWS